MQGYQLQEIGPQVHRCRPNTRRPGTGKTKLYLIERHDMRDFPSPQATLQTAVRAFAQSLVGARAISRLPAGATRVAAKNGLVDAGTQIIDEAICDLLYRPPYEDQLELSPVLLALDREFEVAGCSVIPAGSGNPRTSLDADSITLKEEVSAATELGALPILHDDRQSSFLSFSRSLRFINPGTAAKDLFLPCQALNPAHPITEICPGDQVIISYTGSILPAPEELLTDARRIAQAKVLGVRLSSIYGYQGDPFIPGAVSFLKTALGVS